MKNLIENSISWNRLGRRSKSEYEFAIEKPSCPEKTIHSKWI